MWFACRSETAADREALVDGLERGAITIFVTDHAPHTDEEKSLPFEDVPAGSPGVQTLYLSCLQIAKDLGDVWLAPRWVSEAPALLLRLGGDQGAIATRLDPHPGTVDPQAETRLHAHQL